MRGIVIAALATAGLVGSAAAAEGCIWARNINGFKNATRQSVVLTEAGKEHLAEFQNDCVGIEWAEGLAVDAATSCLTPGDKVVFRTSGGIPQRCFIKTLTEIEKPPRS